MMWELILLVLLSAKTGIKAGLLLSRSPLELENHQEQIRR